MGTLALLEVLDRDGSVHHAVPVHAWPLRVGRALDNDVVLADAHVAPHHFSIEAADAGVAHAAADTRRVHAAGDAPLVLVVGDTRNGVQLSTRVGSRAGSKHLQSAERSVLATQADAIELTAGRTRLRLRLPEHALAAELPLEPTAPLLRRAGPGLAAACALLLGLLFNTYLVTDPGGLGRALGTMLLATVAGGAVWCGAWALLSKTFTHHARFGWHLRVFLFSSIATLVASTLPALLAFTFSWPALSDFAFVGVYCVAAVALYFHLLAVEPARYRVLKWVAAVCAVVGIGLTMWFNLQRSDQFGDELYMNHLFPPALRLARPVATAKFTADLATLQAVLDKKAKEPGRGEEAEGGEE